MRYWDYTHPEPAMNLAVDESLLQHAEAKSGEEVIRFWESPEYFVVLGLTQSVEQEVATQRCKADGIPIQRRCSAGGCVLQGPGCLNFTLILDQEKRPDIRSITSSYRTILNAVIEALELKDGSPAGISDIAIHGKKISGNAQRRRKRFILHHGTLLLGFDTARIAAYLREPDTRPDYRLNRPHDEFVTTLNMGVTAVKTSLKTCLSDAVTEFEPSDAILNMAGDLVSTKYGTPEWIYRK